MAVDWRKYFDDLVKGADWPPSDEEVKKKVYSFVVKWITGDKQTLAKAIEEALKDDKITDKEMVGILAALAQSWTKSSFFGNDFVQRLLKELGDGELKTREVAEVVAEWVASHTPNDTLKQLIKSAADQHLSRDEVEQALLDWLKRIKQDELAEQLRKLLDSPDPLSLRDVVLLVVAYLVARENIKQADSTIQKQIQNVVSALNQLSESSLVQILKAIVDKEYAKAAALLFEEIGINPEDAVIKAILSEELDDAAKEFLKGVLKRSIKDITDDQANALAETVIGIITGKVKLIPEETEQQELKMDKWEHDIWVSVRKVLYAAKLATVGGPLVPTDALASPHIFAAAAIRFDTPVKDLAAKERWPVLLECIKLFTSEEFKRPMGTPINVEMLQEGRAASYVHTYVQDIIHPLG